MTAAATLIAAALLLAGSRAFRPSVLPVTPRPHRCSAARRRPLRYTSHAPSLGARPSVVRSTFESTAPPSSSTRLHSLKPLAEEISAIASSRDAADTPVIFVGGKGGVGKTSVSSALAVELASSYETDLNVLIVSTDPAHSLGDALDVDLRHRYNNNNDNPQWGQPTPTTLSDPLTNLRLHALEVDPRAALEEFQSRLSLFDPSSLSSSLGVNVSPQLLQDLGLDEFQTLLKNPPPGLDELVALSSVLDERYAREYDVIVVDTAPTGHTLRMLALPQFLDGFLQTLLTLRQKLKGLLNTLQMFMGGNGDNQNNFDGGASKMTVDDALAALEEFQRRAAALRSRLKNPSSTKFVVVSIPTILSVRESERLVDELVGEGICVSDLVVNQCVGGGGDDDGAMRRYYRRRAEGQQRWIGELRDACADVSSSPEYQNNNGGASDGPSGISVTTVPFYDMELVGAPALGYLGGQTFGAAGDGRFSRLLGFDDDANEGGRTDPRMVICGGKGGVGKTTTSASLAFAMASAGHDVAVVSTDPAHSLGDALDADLRGGSLVDVPLFGVPPIATPGGGGAAGEGSLKAMEIDPTSALREFRDSIDRLIGKGDDATDSNGNSEVSSTLSALSEIIDTLPAGTDEVVALAKVIQLVRRNNFDRVVLDTAPTGHTLRMLTTPAFLADLIERVLVVSRKLNSNAAIKMFLSSAVQSQSPGTNLDEVQESARNVLLKFQVSMYDLEDLFADPASTEFLIVTIGTELAVRESVRLMNDLTFGDPDMPIRVRNVVVNQVLEDSSGEGDVAEGEERERLQGFVTRLSNSQRSSLEAIDRVVNQLNNPPRVTKVTMMDTEPRGVYGLKALSGQLMASENEAAEVTNA